MDKLYKILLEVATDEEIQLVTKINGVNKQTFEDILYVRTGYRSFDQYSESIRS